MKKLLQTIIICLFSIVGYAQVELQWAKAMGGVNMDRGYSIAIDGYGNVYTTGNLEGTVDFDPGPGKFNLTSAGNKDIFISKLDPSGNFLWAISMGGLSWDEGLAIELDASGNVYTTGSFSGTVDFDPGIGIFNLTSGGLFISKLDNLGNFIWAKGLGPSIYGYSISLDDSGNVYTTGRFGWTADFDPGPGTFNLTSAGMGDIFISKLDSSGNFLWAKSMGGDTTGV